MEDTALDGQFTCERRRREHDPRLLLAELALADEGHCDRDTRRRVARFHGAEGRDDIDLTDLMRLGVLIELANGDIGPSASKGTRSAHLKWVPLVFQPLHDGCPGAS